MSVSFTNAFVHIEVLITASFSLLPVRTNVAFCTGVDLHIFYLSTISNSVASHCLIGVITRCREIMSPPLPWPPSLSPSPYWQS